jgi:cyclopropane fatty-acyl-phospholipid synthase-like methyltransferase
MDTSKNLVSHWDAAYHKDDEQLGWFESNPESTLQLINTCNLKKDASILNVGSGTTLLIDTLLGQGYTNIIANDLSEVALTKLKMRIQKKYAFELNCVPDDLTNSSKVGNLKNIDLWVDRAVLHFFLKEEEQKAYFKLIDNVMATNGFVLIAVFSLDGAEKCCGLDLQRYNLEMLQQGLGKAFKLIETFNFTYINPFGDKRPYIYTLFQKQ